MAAAKSNGWNDFVQIVMLTFLLCALFFGGWGGYLVWANNSLEEERDKAWKDIDSLSKLLKEEENVAAQMEVKRRKASAQGEDISDSVNAMLKVMGDLNWSQSQQLERAKPMDKAGNLLQHTLTIDFHERPLRNYLNLLQHLENRKPHVLIKDISLDNKAKRGEVADTWSGTIEFVSYSSKDDVTPPKKSEG